jgi:hypothetical protein
MNMSGEFHAPTAISLEKELLLRMELEVGWALLNQFNESFSSHIYILEKGKFCICDGN